MVFSLVLLSGMSDCGPSDAYLSGLLDVVMKQKTLLGEILVRKWVSDSEPQVTIKLSDTATHICPFQDCGKAFSDAAGLRKHRRH